MDAFLASTLEFLEWLISLPRQGYTNLTRNAVHMWDDMTTLNYIRMIAIVGGYLFIRPYLQRYGERQQAKQMEKMLAQKEGGEGKGKKAKISPNALRDGGAGKSVKFADEGAESEGEGVGEGGKEERGKKEKKRQKKVVEKKSRASEEEESDEMDIMEHLVDYEEGKDGW
ncbi:trafficking PGA2-domain-containing protein [Cadophora sp. MPI-SDFR-AT-0126]|nr:trafficking PGA2-domain-containing protein [Leotiomycetes sp. MPI-SDFR-AT-0126]